MIRIGVIGDVMGRAGRRAVTTTVPAWREREGLALVIANGENLADGRGCTARTIQEMLDAGIDALTLGNHAWSKREFLKEIAQFPTVIRPANFSADQPGATRCLLPLPDGRRLGLTSAIGRVFMSPVDCPFAAAAREVAALREEGADCVVVDMHCEATSEKEAMGWYLDGHVAAVFGTHTHVPTADERLLPRGTAYITDIGMTGAYDSILGMQVESALPRFLSGLPSKFKVATGNVEMRAIILSIDPATGLATSIERVTIPVAAPDAA